MLKIVIPDDAPPVMEPSRAYQGLLSRADVKYYGSLPASEQELVERIEGFEFVINIRSTSKFTDTVFTRCPDLRLLSLWGTGTDNVDLPAAERHGVTVTNTPGVSAISIAEHNLTLMLAVVRRIPRIDAEVRNGNWPRARVSQLHGKVLGVIGLGAIGRRFAKLGEALGMRVITWTMNPKPELGFEHVPLEQLYRESDVVSMHLRLSPQTEKMVGRDQFALMKPTAVLVNTARGAIIDEVALVEALSTGTIAGAGLDVFEREPLPAGHPLMQLDNVVLTPHSAGVTPESLEAGLQLSVDNIWNFVDGRPANVVTANKS